MYTAKNFISNIYPFNFPVLSISIFLLFLKNKINIANPIAASEAAIVNIKIVNICPVISFNNLEKAKKFKLTASNMISIENNMFIMLFLFSIMPDIPIRKSSVENIEKWLIDMSPTNI